MHNRCALVLANCCQHCTLWAIIITVGTVIWETYFIARAAKETPKAMPNVLRSTTWRKVRYINPYRRLKLTYTTIYSPWQNRKLMQKETKNKTAELSQRRLRDAPNIWVHWKVLRVLTTHPATFPKICNRLLFWSILRMCVQKLNFVALPVPEIIRGTQKIWTVPLHFLPKF